MLINQYYEILAQSKGPQGRNGMKFSLHWLSTSTFTSSEFKTTITTTKTTGISQYTYVKKRFLNGSRKTYKINYQILDNNQTWHLLSLLNSMILKSDEIHINECSTSKADIYGFKVNAYIISNETPH